MKILVLASLLFVSTVASANEPAQVRRIDITNIEFNNFCNPADPVLVPSGTLHVVFRPDFGGDVNGVHLLSKTAGSFAGLGLGTGDQYRVNFTIPSRFVPIPGSRLSNSNFVNGSGMANLLFHIEIINLSNPGSGVSQLKIVIVSVTDGTTDPGFGENKVLEVSMDCKGG
jgi:hypothetical protein